MKVIIAYKNGDVKTEEFKSRVEAEARLNVVGRGSVHIAYLVDKDDKKVMTGLWESEWIDHWMGGHSESRWTVKLGSWHYT